MEPPLHTAPTPTQDQVRGTFASRLGFILAAAGSAVGLGNLWKFPYLVGQNGGAAFLIIYLICVCLIGWPLIIAEFSVGRQGRTSIIGCYRKLSSKPWWLNGLLGLVVAFLILAFYSAVAGWVLRYFVVGVVEGYSQFSGADAGTHFEEYIAGTTGPVLYQFMVMAMTAAVIYFGIEKGIERASIVLMPLLFLMLIGLVAYSLSLDGAWEGVRFLFAPKWEAFAQPHIYLAALGQAFFSLSLGMGVMMIYASYLGPKANLASTAAMVAALDTSVAFLAALMILPAVFAMGLEPGQGPALMFITLPRIFAELGAIGRVAGAFFFFLAFVAALTSTISILEPVVSYLVDERKIRRSVATLLGAGTIFLVGIPVCLSAVPGAPLGEFTLPFFTKQLGLLDFLAETVDRLLLPLGGLVLCLFVLFAWNKRDAIREVAGEQGNPAHPFYRVWYWMAVVVAPICVLLVMINGILADYRS